MIDLDAIEDPRACEELYCQLGASLINKHLTYYDWCAIVMWLDVYQKKEWIPLADAIDGHWGFEPIAAELICALEKQFRTAKSIKWFNEVQAAIGSIEGNYTEQQQIRIAAILEETNGSRMEKSPKNCDTINVQEFEYDYGN